MQAEPILSAVPSACTLTLSFEQALCTLIHRSYFLSFLPSCLPQYTLSFCSLAPFQAIRGLSRILLTKLVCLFKHLQSSRSTSLYPVTCSGLSEPISLSSSLSRSLPDSNFFTCCFIFSARWIKLSVTALFYKKWSVTHKSLHLLCST